MLCEDGKVPEVKAFFRKGNGVTVSLEFIDVSKGFISFPVYRFDGETFLPLASPGLV